MASANAVYTFTGQFFAQEHNGSESKYADLPSLLLPSKTPKLKVMLIYFVRYARVRIVIPSGYVPLLGSLATGASITFPIDICLIYPRR